MTKPKARPKPLPTGLSALRELRETSLKIEALVLHRERLRQAIAAEFLAEECEEAL